MKVHYEVWAYENLVDYKLIKTFENKAEAIKFLTDQYGLLNGEVYAVGEDGFRELVEKY